MNRRNFIGGALSGTALARLAAAALVGPSGPTALGAGAIDVVERFGFVADGRTDNYEAFRRLADFASAKRGGNFVFPKGEYFVGRYIVWPAGARALPDVYHAVYSGCDGLTLSGYGARIVLNGAFHRSARKGRDGIMVGHRVSTFMPFELRHCRNVIIKGFEVDGGVRSMTRDDGVPEGYAHLIALNSCSKVLLKDLDLHHGQVDGILLSDNGMHSNDRPARACRDVVLEKVRCHNNARGGIAPLQVFGFRATDCDFSGNGVPGGRYAYHAPGFGVCVEPDRSSPQEVDTRTGNLEFVRCNFYDNLYAILAAYPGNYRGYCRFTDCNSSNRTNFPNHMIITWPEEEGGMVIDGGTHDAGEGAIRLSWQGWTGSRVTLRRTTIRSSHIQGLLHAESGNLAIVEDCEILGTHRTAESGHFPFFAQDPGGGRRNVFRRNRLFLPAARKDRSTPFDLEPNFHHTDLTENEYSTNLSVPGAAFVFVFNAENCSVRGERFKGAFPGTRDTFRPLASEVHDTRYPYSYP